MVLNWLSKLRKPNWWEESEGPPPEKILKIVLDCVEWLAADADQQFDSYTKGRRRRKSAELEVPDELAITWQYAYFMVPQLVRVGLVSDAQHSLFKQIDHVFDEMGEMQDKTLYSVEGVRNHPEWHRIRLLAREILKSFGRARRYPTYWARK